MNNAEKAEIVELVRWLDEHPTNFTRAWNDTLAECPTCGDRAMANVEDVVTLGVPCVMCGDSLVAVRYRVSRTNRRTRGIYAYSHGRGLSTAKASPTDYHATPYAYEDHGVVFPEGNPLPFRHAARYVSHCVCGEDHSWEYISGFCDNDFVIVPTARHDATAIVPHQSYPLVARVP